MIFFTGDTHFADPRVLRIDRRPFPDMASHDAAIVENWNVVVGQDDDIWHLGDFMSVKGGECAALLAKLNGRKHLIVGNNDPGTTTGSDGWHSVQHYAEIREGGHHLILCHYAFRTWNQMGKGSINLHGHSHGRLKLAPRQFDVGVDSQGLKPVSLTEILDSRKRTKGSSAAI
ncbi:hydrolase [Rhizobium wenxiniae]|uniref:Calcineurin-like phosphoesterase family protein n=1 Tax=Rhizobium wenxiniae TaxID=1737357 RepID=A0A7X0D2G7_9HYPH|nr:hydrolase [Rhizobium wenxiniae]MBB6164501.1 calcineurin-like phosphoesterase family protein [Rhizobium wenxiniae]GGG22630.1 hydrolase [Rhizobium wenxiniae]